MDEGDSVFSTFRRPAQPPSPAPPAFSSPPASTAPAAAPEPAAPAAAARPDPDQSSRLAELEKKLAETQERAISLSVTLREREEAQKAAQREMEDMLRRLSADRRVEQLESKLMDLASRPPKADPRLDDLEKRLRSEEERTAAFQREMELLGAKLMELASRPPKEDPRLEDMEKRLRSEEEKSSSLSVTLREEALQRDVQREVRDASREIAFNRRLDELEDRLAEGLSSRDEAVRARLDEFALGLTALARKLFGKGE